MCSSRDNEDCIAVLRGSRLICAVVCDGAGSFSAGSEAAAQTSQFLTGLLSGRFEEFFRMSGGQAQQAVAHAVEGALRDYSFRSGTPARELACTILAAAVHRDGRCLCLHLGDGFILQRNGPEEPASVVSAPMNGLVPHSTYLTMNCDMERFLRLYRWQCPSLRQLLLLTDGAAEPLGGDRLCGVAGLWDLKALRSLLEQNCPSDDHSAALITRQIPI